MQKGQGYWGLYFSDNIIPPPTEENRGVAAAIQFIGISAAISLQTH